MKDYFLFNEFLNVTIMEEDIQPYLTHLWVKFPSCRSTQPAFTCSESTIETPEQCMKSVQN